MKKERKKNSNSNLTKIKYFCTETQLTLLVFLLFCLLPIAFSSVYLLNNMYDDSFHCILCTASGQLYVLTCQAFLVDLIRGVHPTGRSNVM